MGDIDEENSNVSTLLRENRHFRMHEDLGTGPGIYYLYDRETACLDESGPPVMVADPAGLAAVSPRLQANWDWRAAANFTFGGAGTGLFAVTVIAGLFAPLLWLAALLALTLVGAGLFCVWLEIGRPMRFLNVFLNPSTSWMSREALAALPFFAFGGAFLLWPVPALGLLGGASGLVFVYCQGQILRAAKGIPAWRQPGIVPLIATTGLTEGVALFIIVAVLAGYDALMLQTVGLGLLVLVGLRAALWQIYRGALGAAGAPVAALRELDAGVLTLSAKVQAVVLACVVAGLFTPAILALAGVLTLATGWGFKFGLITRAAFNQGFAINRMPARGAGKSAPGIKPGWTVS